MRVSEPHGRSRSRRSSRRRRRQKWVKRGLVALPLLVLLGLVWVAFSAWTVRGDLTEARSAANRLEQALRDQDATAAETELDALQKHSNRAANWTDGPTWAVLGWTPVLGGVADAIRLMSDALAEVAGDGLSPLVGALSDLEAGRFDPEAGRVPLDELERLGPGLADSQTSFERADDLLAQVEPSGRVGLIQDARGQLADAVDEGLDRLGPVRRAVRLLPPMLGAEGERRYLLVLQNNAEIRSTGGFPGSTFQLSAKDGQIDLVEPVSGNTFDVLEPPGLPLGEQERALYTDRAATRFVDASFIPDFPKAADLMRTRYEQRFDTQLDGVIAADPVLLSYMLQGADPIEVRGVSLTSDNVVQELLSGTYARYEDPAEQDEFFREAGTKAFSALTGDVDPASLIDGMRRGVAEGRVMVTATGEDEQEALAEAGITGALGSDPEVTTLGAYVNDTTSTTGSKLSYYLDYDATAQERSCNGGRAVIDASMRLTAPFPGDPAALPAYVTAGSRDTLAGAQGLTLFLLGPQAGAIEDVRLDGQPVGTSPVEVDGRPGVRVEMVLAPNASNELTWAVRTGRLRSNDVVLDVTPGVQPEDKSSSLELSCG